MSFVLKTEVLESIKSEIIKNLGASKNPRVYIYGSRVKGNHREYSDIDILLKAETYDEQELSKIDFESMDIAYKVDFVLDKNLYENYKDEIYAHMVEV